MSEQKSDLPSLWSTGGLDAFRREFDGLFENFFGRGSHALAPSLPQGVVSPAIDVTENGDAITLTAELPGLAEEDVDIELRDGRLILKGEKKSEKDETRDEVQYSERSYGSFQRVMPIPERVDVEKIDAKFDKGVLVVTMPKKPEAKAEPRKVKIGQ